MFITLEGGEGAGKSTQAHAIAERVKGARRPVLLTREPGGTPFGEVARSIVLRHSIAEGAEPFRLDDTAELLIFAAARAQHVDELIRPSLDQGIVVICDRFTDSTIAYQGYARGMSLVRISQSIELATNGLTPDLTVLLDLPVERGLARRYGDLGHTLSADLFERETQEFHQRVRNGFLTLAAAEPNRFLVLDATQPPAIITTRIWERIEPLL
ncbi:MAG: dTMP kinase [Dehalococcoidia bacterium]